MRIWIDPERSLIFIEGASQSFMPQQLSASLVAGQIHIELIDAGIDIVQADWPVFRNHTGAAFATSADAMAYLDDIFGQGITRQTIDAAISAATIFPNTIKGGSF